ncbi:gas vesicle protein [Streptomyces sp. NPDC059575]|uniref:gas vesicle protein n=1 Tax=Streptomyces sp. NPDC059575 TaxID=3346872 RepID=UPI00369B432E
MANRLGSSPSRAAPPYGQGSSANLADILERVLDKGIVIAGDIQINLLDIELLTIKLRLLVASVDKAKEMGIDWWEHDPALSSRARGEGQPSLADENRRLREEIDALRQERELAEAGEAAEILEAAEADEPAEEGELIEDGELLDTEELDEAEEPEEVEEAEELDEAEEAEAPDEAEEPVEPEEKPRTKRPRTRTESSRTEKSRTERSRTERPRATRSRRRTRDE